jgi:hypothetical protein
LPEHNRENERVGLLTGSLTFTIGGELGEVLRAASGGSS